MQLTLHDANLKILGWIDNVAYDTLSYSDDLLTKDLPTGASTYRLKIPKRKIKSDLGTDYLYKALNERAWISFTYRGKVQLFSIRDVIEDRTRIELYCEDLNAELLNEYANPYSSSKEQTFAQYCEAMELLQFSFLKIGRNEISKEKLSLEFANRETKLARIIALARAFNAEFEFTVRLNPNSSIKDFTLDVYHGHDEKHHGVGTKRNDLVLNYSNGLRNIRRKVSKKNIFNMIVPIGKRSNSTKNKKTVTNNPDGTKTITEKITNENGYVTTVTKVDKTGKVLSKKTVTTVKNNNGTVSKSTSQNTAGSVSTSSTSTVVVTNPDKSTTRTTTTRKSDGTVEKTIVHTKIDKYPDKSTKTTTTTTKPDGSVTERVSWRYANGTSNTTTRVIKPGKSTKSSVVTKVDESDDGEFDLAGMPDWSRKNSDGVLEFYKRGAALYAPISAQLYPSTFTSETGKLDQWTRKDMEFEADSEEELNGKALAELEKYCYPEIIYELDGYIDGDIGDTVIINDTGFDDMLNITARITKQQISFTNPKSNKTEIANVRAVNRMLSSGMQNRLNQIIEETKPYNIQVTTDNGVMFKNGVGTSLVTPILVKGVKEYPEATWRFTLNGETTVGLNYLVNANQIEGTQVLIIAAYIGNEEVASHQLTFANVTDGKTGKAGTSSYTYWAYSAHADGHDMAEQPGADTVYAGQCVTDSKTRPTDYRLYTWSKIKGDKGDTGNGINSVSVSYGSSTSNTVRPTTWTSAIPDVPAGQYLWTRTIIDYTDSSKADTVTYTYSKMGRDGEQGEPGQDGTSVTVKSIQYQAGGSPTTAPTGAWSANLVPVPEGQYLWTKTTFSDNTTAYSVARQGQSAATNITPGFTAGFPLTFVPVKAGIGSIKSIGDGWAHVEYVNNTNSTQRVEFYLPKPDGLSEGVPYTFLHELKNNKSDFVGKFYHVIENRSAFYGNIDEATTRSDSSEQRAVRTVTLRNGIKLEDTQELVRINVNVPPTNTINLDLRVSCYVGIYEGPYVPYQGGRDGNGIANVEELYLVSSQNIGITTSTAGWSTAVPAMTSQNNYLWNYTKTTYTDGTVSSTTPAVIGSLGADGATGKGIQSITEYYLASDKNTGITTSTAGWTTTMQPVSVDKKYLWNYSVTRFTDNSTQTSQVLLIGAYGDTGTFEGEIGGRNLIIDSTAKKGKRIGIDGRAYIDDLHKMTEFIPVEPGKTYVLKYHGLLDTDDRYYYSLSWFWGNAVDYSDHISRPTGPARMDKLVSGMTLKAPSNAKYAVVSYPAAYPKLKLEKGTIATDWSPAPEDIQDQIDSKAQKEDVVYKTDINVTNEGIIHSASKTVNGQTIASMIAQRAEWVEIIARLLKIQGDMLVDGSITSTKFNGNVISSLDGTLVFDLAKSSLVSYSDNSVIRRVSDNQSQFIKMATANKITYTTIGANRAPNDETVGNANFTGMQFRSRSSANGGLVDEAEIWADSFYLSGGSAVGDGIHFKNNQWVRPMASGKLYLGTHDFRWREVHSNEYYINGVVLSTYLKAIRDCFVQLMNGGATQSTYDYIKGRVSAYLNKLP